MSVKRCWIDTETTGIDPMRHSIIQIGMIIEIDGMEVEGRDYRLRPIPGRVIEPKALAVNGLTEEEITSYPDAAKVMEEIKETLGRHVSKYDHMDKYLFMAYNARFDADFLRQTFLSLGDKYFGSWFWTPPIDVMAVAADVLQRARPGMANFRLTSVAEWLGINVDTDAAHDALYDIRLTQAVYRAVKDLAGQEEERND